MGIGCLFLILFGWYSIFLDYKTYLAQLTAQGLPQQFWAVQKLVRYLRIGNQTATVIALCNLVDFDLEKEYVQAAIMEAGEI